MDPQRFDALAQTLARAASRRQALAGLLAGLAGPLLPRVTAAGHGKGKRRQHGKRAQPHQASSANQCTPNKNCAKFCAAVFGANTPAAGHCTSDAAKCQGLCSTKSGCLTNGTPDKTKVCCPGGGCPDYAAATCCATGQACCSGACTPLGTDTNCHDCGDACRGGKRCHNGACQCPSGTTECSGQCVNTNTDPTNCGTCGNGCSSPAHAHNPACNAGTCTFTCDSGYADCNHDPSDGCETVLGTNQHCTGCGNTCDASQCQTCTSTGCASTCTGGTTPACTNGTCVCTATSCEGGQTCQNGACACPADVCAGQCVDTQTDNANCGACGTACTPDRACRGGSCVPCGGPGQPCCADGRCGSPRTCQGGTCGFPASTCDASFSNCRLEITGCGSGLCRCARSLAGEVFCRGLIPIATCDPGCSTDADCGAGLVCITICNGQHCCAPPC